MSTSFFKIRFELSTRPRVFRRIQLPPCATLSCKWFQAIHAMSSSRSTSSPCRPQAAAIGCQLPCGIHKLVYDHSVLVQLLHETRQEFNVHLTRLGHASNSKQSPVKVIIKVGIFTLRHTSSRRVVFTSFFMIEVRRPSTVSEICAKRSALT